MSYLNLKRTLNSGTVENILRGLQANSFGGSVLHEIFDLINSEVSESN